MPTLVPAERDISPEQFQDATSNYFRCLNLPPKSQVLIITDEPGQQADSNLLIRNRLSSALHQQIERDDHRVLTMTYDGSKIPSEPTEEELKRLTKELRKQTARALSDLDNLNTGEEVDRTTTVIYLGDTWTTRTGLYQAANQFGKNHTVKFAGSLGFSVGDCRVMSSLTKEKIAKLYDADERFKTLFEAQPQGRFEITTRDAHGEEHVLNLSYDATKAPFEPEFGNFDNVHETPLGGFKNIKYINIPGGERYGTPYPFGKTNGKFSAEGIVFTVEDGLITNFVFSKVLDIKNLSISQRELLYRVAHKEKIPVSELGLGFYEMVGIDTFDDSSTLSYEKSGPHIGMGHIAEKSREEKKIAKAAGSFRHTDFVMDNPEMIVMDINSQNRHLIYSSYAESH